MRFILLFALGFCVKVCGQDRASPYLPLSDKRIEELWEDPKRANLDELTFAALAVDKSNNLERVVFFLWCSEVRFEYERVLFPLEYKMKTTPRLAFYVSGQIHGVSKVHTLYLSPESHKRVVARLREYVPQLDGSYRPSWLNGSEAAFAEAQAQAKSARAKLLDLSARILELTAIPEYLESLRIFFEDWDDTPGRVSRFRAANDTLCRIEEEKQIKSGLTFALGKPNKAPEPTTTSVTSPAAQEPRQP